ncbi:MAG: heat-shock protein [Spirochaetia bacterium]|nr:heat-shock protein [Spirochaetia bacterium]
MTNKYVWDTYPAFSVGLDDIFTRLEAMSGHNTSYPPYNLIKHDGSNYEIEIALAGFKANEIEVSTEQNILKVASRIEKRNSERNYLHKGLSKRAFSNTWQLSDDVKVVGVDFVDGLLSISLEKIIPEHQKKTVYKIGNIEVPVPQFLTEDRDSNFPKENRKDK